MVRNDCDDRKTTLRSRASLERAPQRERPFGHPDDAGAGVNLDWFRFRRPLPLRQRDARLVHNAEGYCIGFVSKSQLHTDRTYVASNVCQCLLNDSMDGHDRSLGSTWRELSRTRDLKIEAGHRRLSLGQAEVIWVGGDREQLGPFVGSQNPNHRTQFFQGRTTGGVDGIESVAGLLGVTVEEVRCHARLDRNDR